MFQKSFFQKIGKFVSNLFGKLSPALKSAVKIGVTITDKIKQFDTANPGLVDVLTAIIPGTADDILKARLRAALPNIMIELKLVDATLGLTDPNEIMLAAVKVIKQLDGHYNSAFLHSFSILAAQVAADGKLDFGDAVYLLQWYYDNKNN